MSTLEAEVVEAGGLNQHIPNKGMEDAGKSPSTALSVNLLTQAMTRPEDRTALQIAQSLESLDWKRIPPGHAAYLLTRKPFRVSGGGFIRLSMEQALWYAARCYELGLSPLSNEAWFDPNTWNVNITLEGKRVYARNQKTDLGPPTFDMGERPWSACGVNGTVVDLLKKRFPNDISATCKIRVGSVENKEYTVYTAWLSEWYVAASPVWQAKPMHMLQTRAQAQALSMAIGLGASELPTDREE